MERRAESIPIATIRTSNAQVADAERFVAVFIGGTDGIGRRTVKELFTRIKQPRAYLVGRNEDRGKAVCRELQRINPDGEAIFIKRDITLIRDIDDLRADICEHETKINCLFLTAGSLTLGPRSETIEGIDKRMAVNYYSRMRCIMNLMPCLDAAGQANELSRVITVLAAGSEQDIIHTQDLDLKANHNLHECLAHCAIMSDFMMEELAKRHPLTSFCHTFPGAVTVDVSKELTSAARLAAKVLYATSTSWLLDVADSGERHFFQMTSQMFRSLQNPVGVPLPLGLAFARGMNGQPGSGAYLLDWDCRSIGDERTLSKYRALNFGVTVWEHTTYMLDQATKGGRKDAKRPAIDALDGSEDRPPPDPAGWRTEGTLRSRGMSNPNPIGWRPA